MGITTEHGDLQAGKKSSYLVFEGSVKLEKLANRK